MDFDEHLARVKEAFEAEGVDTDNILGDGILHFYMQPGIDPYAFSTVRAQFHEAMHVLADAQDGTTLSEMKASVPERVYLRGRWSFTVNLDDEELFDEPQPIPSLQSVIEATLFRCDTIARFGGNEDGSYNAAAIETIPARYELALADEAFFRCVSRGRALYQFTAAQMREMPLCFFGVYKANEGGYELRRIPEEVRQRIRKRLDDLFAPSADGTQLKPYGAPRPG